MMTKEEYQRNIVRMFDSLRNKHKGEKGCVAVNCDNCPFDGKVCNIGEKNFRAYEGIEIVENWAKENPIKTNADKFREVFGFEHDDVCDVNRFWGAEYMPPKEGEE